MLIIISYGLFFRRYIRCFLSLECSHLHETNTTIFCGKSLAGWRLGVTISWVFILFWEAHRGQPDQCRVAVIGAGPVGGILACRLANAAHSVLLVDRAALPHMERSGFDGRVYAVANGSHPLLEDAGLWQRLPFEPCPIDHIGISDGKLPHSKTPTLLRFDHPQGRDNPFGWIIEARSIRMALNSALKASSRIVLRAAAPALSAGAQKYL